VKNKNYEIDLLESLIQLKCYDDGSYEKALAFAGKSTRSGVVLIKRICRVYPARLNKRVSGINFPPVFYQRYEVIGETEYCSFGSFIKAHIVIYELR